MLAPLAVGESRVWGLLRSADVEVTEAAMRRLGVDFAEKDDDALSVSGPADWQVPEGEIDCGNSGTSARLLIGLLAGLGFPAVLKGDPSLSQRPMDRVVYPLQAMGARLRYLDREGFLPVELEARRSGSLRPLRHRPRAASAQVKSCLLLAGLVGGVRVEISERLATRDHTERMLREMGAPISIRQTADGSVVSLEGNRSLRLSPLDMAVPGDFSSAAFLFAAAWLGTGAVEVRDVGLNRTRTGLLQVARAMGARYSVAEEGVEAGEPVGHVLARPSRLQPFQVRSGSLPGLVDEVPVLAILAARAAGVSSIRGAEELRLKESDRLAVLAQNLRAVGVTCREYADGLEIEGTDSPLAGRVSTAGDHRIAMAFGALGASPGCEISLDDRDCVSISYPAFWRDLERIATPETR